MRVDCQRAKSGALPLIQACCRTRRLRAQSAPQRRSAGTPARIAHGAAEITRRSVGDRATTHGAGRRRLRLAVHGEDPVGHRLRRAAAGAATRVGDRARVDAVGDHHAARRRAPERHRRRAHVAASGSRARRRRPARRPRASRGAACRTEPRVDVAHARPGERRARRGRTRRGHDRRRGSRPAPRGTSSISSTAGASAFERTTDAHSAAASAASGRVRARRSGRSARRRRSERRPRGRPSAPRPRGALRPRRGPAWPATLDLLRHCGST